MTLIPWKAGKPVVWDVTTICVVVQRFIAILLHNSFVKDDQPE